MRSVELNNDQRRETVNTRQRYQSWRNAVGREHGYRGSMVWEETKGHHYLIRSFYDDGGKRRQKSLGRRDEATEHIKRTFETERGAALKARRAMDEVLVRQSAINRALGLNRLPLIAARILRVLDKRGLLGRGMRVVDTNALYAYEAACGVHIDAEITATLDIDLLFDARTSLKLVGLPELPDGDLLQLLRLADRSFHLTGQSFRAENDEGYLVDLVMPAITPPWKEQRIAFGGQADLQAVEIEGLAWLENAPAFEQVIIDERGAPLRIVAPDPRVFAIHKHWLSQRKQRDAVKRQRDREQALAVAQLTRAFLQHLPFESDELRMLPKAVVDEGLLAL